MIAKRTPGSAGGRRASGGMIRAGSRPAHRPRVDPDPHNERVRLITFVWSGRTGNQPVIFADRSWLQ
jgi:hypothetical protein